MINLHSCKNWKCFVDYQAGGLVGLSAIAKLVLMLTTTAY